MAITEEQLREKILTGLWAKYPQAKKIRRNPLISDRAKWAGLLTPDPAADATDEPLAFAFIVRRTGFRKAVKSGFDRHTFEILIFKGFDAGFDNANSEDEFQRIVDETAAFLAGDDIENPLYEFAGEADEITVDELDFSKIGLVASSKTLHFAGGRLVLNVHKC